MSIFKRLRLAQQSMAGVVKDGRNAFAKYDYVSAEALIRDSRVALHNAGLVLVPVSLTICGEGDERRLDAQWQLHDEDGGIVDVSCQWPITIEKGRPIDKATAVARTASLGYLLRDLLLLPRVASEDELDWSGHDEARAGLEQLHTPSAPPAPVEPPPAKQTTRGKKPAPQGTPDRVPAGSSEAFEACAVWLEKQGIANARTELQTGCIAYLDHQRDERGVHELTRGELAKIGKHIVSMLAD
jgi:hypothetical protein